MTVYVQDLTAEEHKKRGKEFARQYLDDGSAEIIEGDFVMKDSAFIHLVWLGTIGFGYEWSLEKLIATFIAHDGISDIGDASGAFGLSALQKYLYKVPPLTITTLFVEELQKQELITFENLHRLFHNLSSYGIDKDIQESVDYIWPHLLTELTKEPSLLSFQRLAWTINTDSRLLIEPFASSAHNYYTDIWERVTTQEIAQDLLQWEISYRQEISDEYPQRTPLVDLQLSGRDYGQLHDFNHPFSLYKEKPGTDDEYSHTRYYYDQWLSFADKPEHYIKVARVAQNHLNDQDFVHKLVDQSEERWREIAPLKTWYSHHLSTIISLFDKEEALIFIERLLQEEAQGKVRQKLLEDREILLKQIRFTAITTAEIEGMRQHYFKQLPL